MKYVIELTDEVMKQFRDEMGPIVCDEEVDDIELIRELFNISEGTKEMDIRDKVKIVEVKE